MAVTIDGPILPSITRGRQETAQFEQALLELGARGLRTHCSDPGSRYLWLSDNVQERREAERLCRGCPVLVPCGAAATARRERFGVWVYLVVRGFRPEAVDRLLASR